MWRVSCGWCGAGLLRAAGAGAGRRSFTHPQRFLDSEARWRARDGLPAQWELVYKAPMETVINGFTTFVSVSSGALLALALYYASSSPDLDAPILIGDSDVVIANNFEEFSIYIAAFIILHAAVRTLISRYVIRLYKNDDKYLAIFRGHFYNSTRKHEFDIDEFVKLKPTRVVSWGESRFALGSKKGILLEDYFKTPGHFNDMLLNRKTDNKSK